MTTVIETPRCFLRRFTSADIDAVIALLSHPEVMRFSILGPHDREQCIAFIDRCLLQYRTKGYGLYAVTVKPSDHPIGYCGFNKHLIDDTPEIEVGYRLHPDFWGKGLATEASRAVLDYGFQTLGFTRLISIIEAENTASIRVAEKNGLIHEKDARFQDKIPVRIYAVSK